MVCVHCEWPHWLLSCYHILSEHQQYYEEIVRRTWRPRNVGAKEEDFIASTEMTHDQPQLMLKTDMCFWYDTDVSYPCCSKTNRFMGGNNRCDFEDTYSTNQCSRYQRNDPEMEAVWSVVEYLGGPPFNTNNAPFYKGFARAWWKATTNGHDNLRALRDDCGWRE